MTEEKHSGLLMKLIYVSLSIVIYVVAARLASDVLYERETKKFQRLIAAAGSGDIEALKEAVETGANVNATPPLKRFLLFSVGRPSRYTKWTPLHEASVQGQADAVRFLIERGADVHAEAAGFLSQPLDTLLVRMAKAERIDASKIESARPTVAALVEAGGLDDNNQGVSGRRLNLLTAAVSIGDADILKMLNPSEADPNERGYALEAAAAHGRKEFFDLLHFQDVPPERLGRALIYGAARNDMEMVEMLVTADADVNSHSLTGDGDPEYASPLHAAAGKGSAKLVEYLLNKGADPAFKDKNGKTPREVAHEDDTIRLLEKPGAADK
jgi:ankyrin repeat protein